MFYSVEDLSPKQQLLPSGTLLARDAVIARTGTQRYHLIELPDVGDAVAIDREGLVDVTRDPADVFDARSMASFEAVPITLGHPDEPVGPHNWNALSVGHLANVKRDGDLLVGDLLIHDRRGIHAVRELGWRGLSAGYDAGYAPVGDGTLRQHSIVANHVALLPPGQEARCGDLCRVADSMPGLKQALLERNFSMRTRDAWRAIPKLEGGGGDSPDADPRNPTTGVFGAQESKGRVGAKLVQRLPRGATAYFIQALGDGTAGLFEVTSSDDLLDPGKVGTGNGFVGDAARRRIINADATRSQQTLRSINARNREFYNA